MEDKEKEVMNRFIECIENNTKAVERFTDVVQVVINNNNTIIENVTSLNSFAKEIHHRFNNSLMVIDAMSICLFEKNAIEEKRFQEVMEQLYLQHHQQNVGEKENGECNGDCNHETCGEKDCNRTEE